MKVPMKPVLAVVLLAFATVRPSLGALLRQPSQSDASDEALRRVKAVEDQRSSHVLCRLAAEDGQGFATVRLQPDTNERSLVFNDDVAGVETKVKCLGAPDDQCLAAAPAEAKSIDECLACPCSGNDGQLFGAYGIAMAEEVDKRCKGAGSSGDSGSPMRVLLLGLGGGELATHIVNSCGEKNVQLETVELDSRLPALAFRYFGLPKSVKVTVGDAGPVVASLQRGIADNQLLADGRRYDVVLVDCFSDGGVTPEHCRSAEFVHNLRSLLRDGGEILHHLWHVDERHPEVASDFQATVSLYKETFGCKDCGAVDVRALSAGDGDAKGPDSIVVASGPAGADDGGI